MTEQVLSQGEVAPTLGAQRWSVNVTVHGIGDPGRPLNEDESRIWISMHQFEDLLDAAVGRPHVAITFDDGNASDIEIGLPRLRERGLRATFFVCAGLIGQPGRLTAGDVRELHDAGMRIGSHGWDHRDWRTLDWSPAGSSVVHDEMLRARTVLGELVGTDVSEVAIPFGSYDRHVITALRRTGATRVYTSDGGRARSASWLQPRNSIRGDDPPDWPQRVIGDRPPLSRRLRGSLAKAAKRVRG